MPDARSLEFLRDTLQDFADEVGGSLLWEPTGMAASSASVEWFQKDILRGVNVCLSETPERLSLTAYASTVKRGQRWGRKMALPEIPLDADILDALCAGKTAAQAMMEKSFTAEITIE